MGEGGIEWGALMAEIGIDMGVACGDEYLQHATIYILEASGLTRCN